MTDREKVMNGLRCLSGYKEMVENPCAGCGYADCQTYAICVGEVATDALELLKEQESEKTEYIWGCPNCGSQIIIKTSKANSAIGVCLTVCPICRHKVLYGKVK